MSTGKIVLIVIVAAVFLAPLLVFVRMGWRLLRGEDEFVAGGSLGDQMTTPVEHKHSFRRLFGRVWHRRAATR